MKGQTTSSKFSFNLSSEETLNNVDHLKMVDYERFRKSNQIGVEILALAKENQWEQLQKLTEEWNTLLPFLKLEIEDAFITALNFRNIQTIRYFLQNGFKIASVAEDAPLTVTYALEYLKQKQAPLELLELVLAYGGKARSAGERDSNTALHIAAQFGNIAFLKLLLDYGADVNAVNDERQTPLGVAIKNKKQAAIDFLRQKGGLQKWNE